MEMKWCWRCQLELPMLTDEEFAEVSALRVECMSFSEEIQKKYGLNKKGGIDERFKPALDKYFEITGFKETNINAVVHHVISQFGPDCKKCNKPLRSPDAAKCVECGLRLEQK